MSKLKIVKEWVAALKSGQYSQCRKIEKEGENYCAIGLSTHLISEDMTDLLDEYWERIFDKQELKQWIRNTGKDGYIGRPNGSMVYSYIIWLNDIVLVELLSTRKELLRFDEIAVWLETFYIPYLEKQENVTL